jgi:DNA-binding Lrp family transcriptional regulator
MLQGAASAGMTEATRAHPWALATMYPLSSPVRRGRVVPGAEGTMQTIFIMVKCELGKAYDVADDACSVEQVSEVYSTSGQYDLLMKCYLDDKTDIGHFVTSKIQTLAGVKDTFTLITFKAFS